MANSNIASILQFFDFEKPTDPHENFRATCHHCTSKISGSLKVTSNFVTHMKRKHREILLLGNKKISEQPKLTTFIKGNSKYGISDQRQLQITDAIVMFVAGDLLPLATVESENFRNLMTIADPKYQLPSRKHFTSKLLHEKSSEIRNNVKAQLKKAESVCLTIDLWSSRQMRGFLGITGHVILDWTMKSVMICCKRFKGRHTSENIRQEYEEVISSYEIGGKIATIVSDNAANMIKAFALPGFESEPLEKGEDIDSDDDSDDEIKDNCEDDIYIMDCLPNHSRCYAHSLQLVVKDGLKECSPHLKTIITKASNIVSFVRKSVNASEILEDENKLQASNATRWNSQLYMLRSILRVPEEKLNSIDCKYKLSSYERKLLNELCMILDPFEKATLLVQKEITVSGSLTIPVTLGLKHQVNQISVAYSSKMVSSLSNSIDARLSQFESEECYILASLLDPRFKIRWCETEKVDKYVDILKKKVNQLSSSVNVELEYSSPPCKKVKTEDFFSFMPSTPPNRKRNPSGIVSEVNDYISEPCTEMSENPLMYWQVNSNKFPLLSTLARKHLAIPATSAPVERLFSIAGKVFRPERCRLNDKTFEQLMMIKCNAKTVL